MLGLLQPCDIGFVVTLAFFLAFLLALFLLAKQPISILLENTKVVFCVSWYCWRVIKQDSVWMPFYAHVVHTYSGWMLLLSCSGGYVGLVCLCRSCSQDGNDYYVRVQQVRLVYLFR